MNLPNINFKDVADMIKTIVNFDTEELLKLCFLVVLCTCCIAFMIHGRSAFQSPECHCQEQTVKSIDDFSVNSVPPCETQGTP